MTTTLTLIQSTDISTLDDYDFTRVRGFAANTNGTIFYASVVAPGGGQSGVLKSTNSGVSWNYVYTNSASTSIACSSDGVIVYSADLGNGLLKSTDSGSTWNYIVQAGQPLPNNPLPGYPTNPEGSGPFFPGYDFGNVYQIACDSTGNNLIMTTNAAAVIYTSADGGTTWANVYVIPSYSTNPYLPTRVASNTNGSVLYAVFNNEDQNIYKSTDNGTSWTLVNTYGISGPYAGLTTNITGDFLFASDGSGALNIIYTTHAIRSVITPPGGSIVTACTAYNNGNNVVLMQNPDAQTYLLGLLYPPGPVPGGLPCFTKGTLILTPEGEKPVETLKTGDNVMTADGRTVTITMFNYTVKQTNTDNAPFSIAANSLGQNCPPKTICLSGRHAIQDMYGKWQIPKFLALHIPDVKQYGLGEPVEYYHIECPDFYRDNLVANGAVVESFKNRQGSLGVVYTYSSSVGGWVRSMKGDNYPIPTEPTTAMIYA